MRKLAILSSEINTQEQVECSNEESTRRTFIEDEPSPKNAEIVIDIGENGDVTHKVFVEDFSDFISSNEALTSLTDICRLYRTGVISEESFSSSVKNAIAGVGNIVGHFVNLFTAALFHGWRDFKRSDLTAYCDSNKVTMLRIRAQEFVDLDNISVPVPQGMVGKYSPAIESLKTYLDVTDMPLVTRKISDCMRAILKDIGKGGGQCNSYINSSMGVLKNTKSLKSFDDTTKIFTTSKDSSEKKIRDVFISTEDIMTCVSTVSDMDSHMRAVAGVYSRVKNIENTIDGIIAEASNLHEAQVRDLVAAIKLLGDTVSRYAMVLNDTQRVSHNLCWVLKSIREERDL